MEFIEYQWTFIHFQLINYLPITIFIFFLRGGHLALSAHALIFLPTGLNLYRIIKILTAEAFRMKHFYRMSKFPPNVNKILVSNSMFFSFSRCPPFSLWKSPIQSLIQTQVSSQTNQTRNKFTCFQMLVARLVLARNNKNLYFIVFYNVFK